MADTEMYRGDDAILVSDELVEAMTARGWSTDKKSAGGDHAPVDPDRTPQGAPEGTTEKSAGADRALVDPDRTTNKKGQ